MEKIFISFIICALSFFYSRLGHAQSINPLSDFILYKTTGVNPFKGDKKYNPALSPWDASCAKLDFPSQSCMSDPSLAEINKFNQQIATSHPAQVAHENWFFEKFMRDQAKQTSCEQKMLTAIDLLPGIDGCADDLAHRNTAINSEPLVSKSAYEMQKTILTRVYKSLPDLSKKSKACDAAKKKKKELKNELSSVGGKDTANEVFLEDEPIVKEATQMVIATCGAFSAAMEGQWSGETPQMQNYLKEWIDRYNWGKVQMNADGEKKFMNEALPTEDGQQGKHYNNNSITQKNPLVFEEKVVNPLVCNAKHRANNLSKYVDVAHDKIINGANANVDARIDVMKDNGQAALAFMARDPDFKNSAKGLTCQIMRHYSELPKRQEMVENVGIGLGVTAASIAALNFEGLGAGVVFFMDGVAAYVAGKEIPKACSNTVTTSMQLKPICEDFQNAPLGSVPSDFTSQIENRTSCASATFNTVLAVAGAAASGVKAAKVALEARELETVGELAAGTKLAGRPTERALAQEASAAAPGGTKARIANDAISSMTKQPMDPERRVIRDALANHGPDDYTLEEDLEKLGYSRQEANGVVTFKNPKTGSTIELPDPKEFGTSPKFISPEDREGFATAVRDGKSFQHSQLDMSKYSAKLNSTKRAVNNLGSQGVDQVMSGLGYRRLPTSEPDIAVFEDPNSHSLIRMPSGGRLSLSPEEQKKLTSAIMERKPYDHPDVTVDEIRKIRAVGDEKITRTPDVKSKPSDNPERTARLTARTSEKIAAEPMKVMTEEIVGKPLALQNAYVDSMKQFALSNRKFLNEADIKDSFDAIILNPKIDRSVQDQARRALVELTHSDKGASASKNLVKQYQNLTESVSGSYPAGDADSLSEKVDELFGKYRHAPIDMKNSKTKLHLMRFKHVEIVMRPDMPIHEREIGISAANRIMESLRNGIEVPEQTPEAQMEILEIMKQFLRNNTGPGSALSEAGSRHFFEEIVTSSARVFPSVRSEAMNVLNVLPKP